jgi:ferrous-iron efflux pump FieF
MRENRFAQDTLLVVALVSGFLFLIKLYAYVLSGSVIVLASFLDSLFDSLISLVNRVVNKKSHDAADKEHPFGHGGFEVIGSLVQGLLMIFFAANLLFEAVRKLIEGDFAAIEAGNFQIALGVMLFATLAGAGIHLYFSRQLRRMHRHKLRSLALLADQAHYSGDAVTNGLSVLGLLLIYFTQWWVLDAVFGVVAAIALLLVAFPVLRKTFNDIVHSEAPPELQQGIVDIVLQLDPRIKGLHQLRSRQFGPSLFVDFHLKVSENLHLKEAHHLSDRVTSAIKKTYPNADVVIHLDPASEEDEQQWEPSYSLKDS